MGNEQITYIIRPIVKVEEIDRRRAKEILAKNPINRRRNQRTIDLYAEQMNKGLWRLSNDAISFDVKGNLINGQHRLSALLQSNCSSLQFLVAYALPENSFEIMDNGKPRSVADVLSIEKIPNYTNVASIVKRKMSLMKRSDMEASRNHTKSSNSLILEEYKRHKLNYDEIAREASRLRDKQALLTVSDYGGHIAYLFIEMLYPYDQVITFFRELVGLIPETHSVINLYRSKIINDMASIKKAPPQVKECYLIKTWNAYISGTTLKILKYNEKFDKNLWFNKNV